MRTAIELTAKIYRCQSAAKKLYRDEYPAKIEPYKKMIREHQRRFSMELLPSVLELCSFKAVRECELAVMLLMAAAVDLIGLNENDLRQ